MLREQTAVDKIEFVSSGHLQVRRATTVTRDGEEIARTYHRVVYAPGDDIGHETAEVQAIAAVVWTPAAIAAFRARQAESTR